MSAQLTTDTADAAARRSAEDEASGTVLDPLARDAGAPQGQPERRSSAARLFALGRRPSWTLVLAIAVVAVAVLWAIVPGLFTTQNPIEGVPADKLLPPSAAHWFGTDAIGRDLYARVVYGAIHSLSGALIAVTVGLAAGTLIGVIAGSVGGVLDDILMRVVDVLLSIPGLLLSLSIIILLGFGTVNAAIAVGVGSVASFARLSRSEVVRVRRTDYVEAAFGTGGTFVSVLSRHVLPNSLSAVIGLAALQFGAAILAISTLGFLGYGAPPPTPEWGLLIAEGRNYVATAWWLTTLPGLVVVIVVLSANRISQSIGRGPR
ncbi:ABC transporter permease [Microbacterium sp. SSM24]|uniref:ABC transporter permease n=1 Tax=Microbacterium sp. SSM24 TaxID=2991714 RepID=UPI00222739D7|nr:ABC transporter permease [Microbacterium sp. SSM24]MCW3492497.1 ABC transporter permease [Microbacterium sp. SSM24]